MQRREQATLLTLIVLLIINLNSSLGCDNSRFLNTYAEVYESPSSRQPKVEALQTTVVKKIAFKVHIIGKNVSELCYNSFEGFKTLHTLKIEESNLIEINPKALNNVPHLRLISFANNAIEVIEEDVFTNLSLTHLHLENNRIKDIYEKAFHFMPNLTFLDLSFNKIKFLNKNWFKGCEKLAVINLESNQIGYVPEEAFHHLKGRFLYQNQAETFLSIFLSRNQIFRVDKNAFKGLEGLEELSLSGNLIRNLDDNIFSHFSFFKSLNLGSNNIECLSENVLKASETYLESNPWNCDCLRKLEVYSTRTKDKNIIARYALIACKRQSF